MSLGHSTVKSGQTSASRDGKLSCQVVTINREGAKHLLESTYFPLQREISQDNVDRLAGEMKRGWFMEGTPLHFAILPNGNMQLLNGHHSLKAIIQTNSTIDFIAIYRKVKDQGEAGRFYARFDIHKRRTWADAYRAADLQAKVDFDVSWIGRFGSSIRAILSGFQGKIGEAHDVMMSRELQIGIFEKYTPYASAYIDSLAYKNGVRSGPWRRANVMGVGLELFRWQPAKAQKFFHGASEDSGLARNDPRKLLLEYLRGIDSFSTRDRRYISWAVMIAWNAFFKGQEIEEIRPEQLTEFKLLGTPWKRTYDPMEEFSVMEISPVKPTKLPSIRTGTRVDKSGAVRAVSEFRTGRSARA